MHWRFKDTLHGGLQRKERKKRKQATERKGAMSGWHADATMKEALWI